MIKGDENLLAHAIDCYNKKNWEVREGHCWPLF
jgi:hypothetical protein